MSRRFKEPDFGFVFHISRYKDIFDDNCKCEKKSHSKIKMSFELNRFDIFVQITDCSDCVRVMVNQINRCRSKKQLYLLLTKLKEKYADGNNSKKPGIKPENSLLSV